MEKTDGAETIRQTAFLLSAIVRRIKEKRLDKDSNPRFNRNAPEKRAEPGVMVTNGRKSTTEALQRETKPGKAPEKGERNT